VACEGYRSSADERVLRGSCGVEYRVALTSRGREQHPSLSSSSSEESGGLPAMLFLVIFFGVVLWMARSEYSRWAENRALGGGRRVGGGPRRGPNMGGFDPRWGGGGDDDDHNNNDPPPPYPGTRPPSSGGPKRSTGGGAAANNAWRPGFWSGAAGGAAAGYAAGRYASGGGSRSSSSGRGTRTERGRERYDDMPPAPSGVPRASSPVTQTTSSTGFGGTSRR
jgi:hypothetical protein